MIRQSVLDKELMRRSAARLMHGVICLTGRIRIPEPHSVPGLVAAAGLSACGLFAFMLSLDTISGAAAASSNSQDEREADNRLQDIQIGEHQQYTRIALICRNMCTLEERADGFLVRDLYEDLQIDLSARSRNAIGLSMKPSSGGSVLAIQSDRNILRTFVNSCQIVGGPAVCVDLEFTRLSNTALKANPRQGASSSTSGTFAPGKASALEGSPRPEIAPKVAPHRSAVHLSTPHPSSSAPLPSIAEASSIDANTAAKTDSAEQHVLLAKPASVGTLRDPEIQTTSQIIPASLPSSIPFITPTNQTAELARSLLKPVETNALLARLDFRDQAELMLSRTFTRNQCDEARLMLQEDAWALEAMATIGFCQGADGDFQQAEDTFKRLLAQNAENYEALIGRALIAAITGEAGIARKYLGDALTTRPPVPTKQEVNKLIDALR